MNLPITIETKFAKHITRIYRDNLRGCELGAIYTVFPRTTLWHWHFLINIITKNPAYGRHNLLTGAEKGTDTGQRSVVI